MWLRGKVFSGAARGAPLIEKYYPRLMGVLGFRPYFGTLNVRLERNIDLRAYATKKMQHVLIHGGKTQTDAFLAPVTIRKVTKIYDVMKLRDGEDDLIDNLDKFRKRAGEDMKTEFEKKDIAEGHACWAIQFHGDLAENGVIELVSKEKLRTLLSAEDGDTVEILITEKKEDVIHNKNKL